jgi:hypothetical protein
MSIDDGDRTVNKQPKKRTRKGGQAEPDGRDERRKTTAAKEPGDGQPKRNQPRKRSSKSSLPPGPAASAGESERNGEDRGPQPRSFTAADAKKVRWFFGSWIPRGFVTLLVGEPSAGKSTFGAHLVSHAKRALVFPGDEPIHEAVIPRLVKAGANLENVGFCPASDGWEFPRHRDRLIQWIKQNKAELVLIDPLDNYLGEGIDENKNLDVRSVLDALSRVAEETGAAIVIIRHPGKAKDNILAGSRAFGWHPRVIVRLAADPDDRNRGVIDVLKCSLGRWPATHHYNLEGEGENPKRFILGGEVEKGRAREQAEVPERRERRKIDRGADLLLSLLGNGQEMESRLIYKKAEDERLSERTMGYAAERLGVKERREGFGVQHRCMWSLPKGE